MACPKIVHDIQVFLSLANLHRRFIKADHASNQNAKKNTPFCWNDDTNAAFKQLKEKFTIAPVLQHFNPSLSITVETDASDFAIAGVSSQPDINQKLHRSAYYSRKLTDAEVKYDIYDKEMLVM